MSTIADVAARAGVSKATASRALSGRGYVSPETRARVERAAEALSYVAHSSATSLATGRTMTVGVIVPSIERWFFSELLAGAQEALIDAGYDLTLFCLPEHSAARRRVFDDVLPRRRYDGLIAAGVQPEAGEMDQLIRADRPVVCVGPHNDVVDNISIDDAAAAAIATEHLIDLGHTEIAFIGGAASAAGFSVSDRLRLEGHRAAMTAAGLRTRTRVSLASGGMPSGYEAAVDLLGNRRTRPTAVVGVCDEVAIGTIIAARRLGIAVPTELSVVGVDDHEYAEMFALTTIRQQPREQGREAVRMLMRRLDDPDSARQHAVAASALVVRNSSTAPR
ncbi:DNA-binding LacI/PurR family transcriptional regulator [Microbacterium ginsengiterrae]|uniref:DNA-binding LacI/PurR family transcriptional regulator n=1 Tax=Microbacterium ginsengiterrae TaxID=546115 RepID=A0A7W9CAM1_9MICO|nr:MULTISPECIES: LacI family DNA-binding transcriptional regulator [Microbacterium]MBB5742087.1 DNA-binding LacI/PurR family transcriptional regulator [Microbacterium ginsengiterrae]